MQAERLESARLFIPLQALESGRCGRMDAVCGMRQMPVVDALPCHAVSWELVSSRFTCRSLQRRHILPTPSLGSHCRQLFVLQRFSAVNLAVSRWFLANQPCKLAIMQGEDRFDLALSRMSRSNLSTRLEPLEGHASELADQGNKYTRFRLGEMYRDGDGVPRDYASAQIQFNLAANFRITVTPPRARDEFARKPAADQVARKQ